MSSISIISANEAAIENLTLLAAGLSLEPSLFAIPPTEQKTEQKRERLTTTTNLTSTTSRERRIKEAHTKRQELRSEDLQIHRLMQYLQLSSLPNQNISPQICCSQLEEFMILPIAARQRIQQAILNSPQYNPEIAQAFQTFLSSVASYGC